MLSLVSTGLVTAFGGYTIPIFSGPTQPCNLRLVLATSGEEMALLCSSVPCNQDCLHSGLSQFKALAIHLSRLSS